MRELRERGITPRKAWGQNFLQHPETATKIAKWAGLPPHAVVLEIGPGLGALTEAIHQAGHRVIAVERDRDLYEILQKKWRGEPWLTLVLGDALEIDLRTVTPERFHVAANLPYAISTPLLERFIDIRERIESMTLLLQEEVVDRLTADVGTSDHGRLTVWSHLFFDVERGPRISRGNFFPEPDVESRLVKFLPRSLPQGLSPDDVDHFLRFVAQIFRHRRKTVFNGLRSIGLPTEQARGQLERVGIDPSRRPQTLTVGELIGLWKSLVDQTT